jgi:hypothetical protein
MTQIKVYLDEDVHHLIAHALRLRGWEAMTTIDARRQGTDDLSQIRFPAGLRYSILSYNSRDFPRLHNEIISAGSHHAGIIVATQENPSANARALLTLVSTCSSSDMLDELVYLNNWMGRS